MDNSRKPNRSELFTKSWLGCFFLARWVEEYLRLTRIMKGSLFAKSLLLHKPDFPALLNYIYYKMLITIRALSNKPDNEGYPLS